MSEAQEYKVFEVSYDWTGWSAKLRIQQNEATLEAMQEMLLFWMGGQDRIDDCEGDVQQAWLLMFAETAIKDSMDWNVKGVISCFSNREGWCPINGECGIELIAADSFEFESDDFRVSECVEDAA